MGHVWWSAAKRRMNVFMFIIAMENDYALKNPAKGVRLAKNRPDDRIVLSVEEQKDFFECAAGTFYHNLFVVAVNAGLRSGERCALEEADLNFKEHIISVTKTLLYQKLGEDEVKMFHVGPPKTESSVRTVPVNEACERAFRQWPPHHQVRTF